MPGWSGIPWRRSAEALDRLPESEQVSTHPRRDVDLASYGLVSMLPEGPDRGYQDLGWRPRLAFETMAKLEAADSGQPPGPQGRARHGHKVPARSDQASSSSRRARN